MFQIKLSETTAARRRIPILLVDATDGYTPETGITSPTIKISKNGATQATGTGTFTEIGTGQYYYEFASGEVDTLGWIAFNLQKSGTTRDYNAIVQIMAYDAMDVVRLGLTALPNAAAEALGGLATLSANQTSNGTIPVNVKAIAGQTANASAAVTFPASIGTSTLDAGGAADAVWDEVLSGHLASGSTGAALNAAGAAGDPWSTSIPGTYGAGTAGYIVGTNLDAAITSRLASGNVTVGSIASNAITAASINNGAITTVKFAGGAITSAVLGDNSITADKIAAGAITASEVSTEAAQEIANAVWSANITNDYAISPASSTAWANDTMGKRVLRSSGNTDATEAVVADAVWEEPRGDHDTGNTMGHSLDQIRKANFTTEGIVNSTTGATTTSFRTNLTGVNDTYQHQTILFVNSAALNGQSAPILSYAQTNGVITLGDGLTVAPSLNDEFVILPTHVYPMSYIVTNILEGNTSTSTYAAGDVGNILARLHNMIEADGADFRYTTNALEQAPSGGGGGGGSTTVRMGPFVIKAEGQGSDEPLDINKGATHAIECQLVDAEGTGVDITGATLTAKVYNSAGTLVETVSGTISYAALGQVRWIIGTTTTNTAGTYTVTITRTTGASDTQIFGPLRVYVRDI